MPRDENIRFVEALVMSELLKLANLCKKYYDRFVIDELVETALHTVSRFPPLSVLRKSCRDDMEPD